MRRLAVLTALIALALPASASAYPFLSKAEAARDTKTVALESAHRIWRLSDTRVEAMNCSRYRPSIVMCYVTVGLHFTTDECTPPVEESAMFVIGKASRSEYLWRQEESWEQQPVTSTEAWAGCRQAETQRLEGEG
jgi:hypothetical protein